MAPEEAKKFLSSHQVNVAKILLAKCIPDIKMIELTGEEGTALLAGINVNFVKSPEEDDKTSE